MGQVLVMSVVINATKKCKTFGRSSLYQDNEMVTAKCNKNASPFDRTQYEIHSKILYDMVSTQIEHKV